MTESMREEMMKCIKCGEELKITKTMEKDDNCCRKCFIETLNKMGDPFYYLGEKLANDWEGTVKSIKSTYRTKNAEND